MEDGVKVVRERGVRSVNLATAFPLRTRLCPPLTYFCTLTVSRLEHDCKLRGHGEDC